MADYSFPLTFHGNQAPLITSPLPVHTKRGRGATSPPREGRQPAASPVANFLSQFPKQADSPLQDGAARVKKAKPAEDEVEESSLDIVQNLDGQFEEMAEGSLALPDFPIV